MLVLVAAVAIATIISVAVRGDGPSPTSSAGTPSVGEDRGQSAGLRATAAAVLSAQPTLPLGASGFTYPIRGGCLPEDDSLMPGAPRAYRRGIHEGVDFYQSDNCAVIGLDTDVIAAKAGTVIRADRSYGDLTSETLAELMERVEENGGDEVVDAFRGRQVWVDHGNGVVTRYAHLNRIADSIEVGTQVEAGAVIAYVGESGTVASVTEPGTQMHLHFEIRVDESYLGQALDPATARRLYQRAFSP